MSSNLPGGKTNSVLLTGSNNTPTKAKGTDRTTKRSKNLNDEQIETLKHVITLISING